VSRLNGNNHHAHGRHRDGRALGFGKRQANVLKRHRQSEPGCVSLRNNLVAIDSAGAPANHRIGGDFDERPGVEPAARRRRSAGRGGNRQPGPPAEDDRFGYEAWQSFREPIEAAIAIGYRAVTFAEEAGVLNRAFCSSLSVA
jgi:hypothetical protein